MNGTVRLGKRRLRLAATTALAGISLGLSCAAAHAQTAASAPASAQPSQVQEVIVTAQRRSENIQKVPLSITALGAAKMQAMGLKDSTDIGRVTPNVTIALPDGAGNQPLINIRGVGLNDYDTNNAGPNGVYVDDVYISSPAMQTFALFDLSQIQVLKGPQGTLYGMNTSGGAVVFTSNKPTDHFTDDFHLEYGDYNSLQLEGAVGGPITPDLQGRIAGVFNYSDGYMKNTATGASASGSDNGAVRLELAYRPTDKLSIQFNSTEGYIHNLPTEYRHIGVYQQGTQSSGSPVMCTVAQAFVGGCVDLFGYGTPKGFYDGEWSRDAQMHVFNALNALRVDYRAGPVTLTSITSAQYSNKYFPEDSDAGPEDLLWATYGVTSTTLTQEFRAAGTAQNFNWQGGVYYLHEYLQQNQPLQLFYNGDTYGGFGLGTGPGAFDGVAEIAQDHAHQTTNAYAVYGQGDYTLGQFTLTLGARYTYEQKTFDYFGDAQFQDGGTGNYAAPIDVITRNESQDNGRFTWRAALTYHFTNQILAYASAATGFKSGDFNGSFLSNVQAQADLQLKPVAPEDVTAYEVGFKSTLLDRRLVVDGAAFYYDYRNEQIFVNVPQIIDNPVLGPIEEDTEILANAKQAHTEGVELEVTATPLPGLTLDLQPAYLDAQIDHAGLDLASGSVGLDGKQLANSPHWSFTASADYRLPLGEDALLLDYNASFKSHMYFDSTNDPYTQQNAYWIQNANITYQSRTGWSAGLFVRNLAGVKYYSTIFDSSSPFGYLEGVVGMPRTYGFDLTYHY